MIVYPNLILLQNPSTDDGGDYRCIVVNEYGQLQAKLNLNIEAEPESLQAGKEEGMVFDSLESKPQILKSHYFLQLEGKAMHFHRRLSRRPGRRR